MDYSHSFERISYKNNVICCELATKIKHYINILKVECTRLNSLQTECNQLLDQFYALKHEFDFLVNESLPLKYCLENNAPDDEDNEEFSSYAKNVWQIGKHRFLDKGKRSQYMCFIGSPLVEVTATILNFANDILAQVAYLPYHTECATEIHSTCCQIVKLLRGDSLNTAEACLRQYVYLQSAVPFLQELNNLVNQYLLYPDIHTPKQFVDAVILLIPPLNLDDAEVSLPFRFVIDLLNGKLLDKDFLDHNSDIKPVVEDDINLKRSTVIRKTVEWITQQYKVENVPKALRIVNSPLISADYIKTKRSLYNEIAQLEMRMSSPSPKPTVRSHDGRGTPDLNRNNNIYFSPPLYKRARRSYKVGPMEEQKNANCDLQPINLHALQTPLLPPLL